MKNIILQTAIGALVLVAALGAGCGKSSNRSTTGNSNSENSPTGSQDTINTKDTFNETVEIEMDLSDSQLAKTEQKMRSILKNVFGKIKLNSYTTGMFGEKTLFTEYTANRVTKAADVSLLSEELKDDGFQAKTVGVNNGTAMGFFSGKEYELQISFEVGKQTVIVQYLPGNFSSQFGQ